MNQRAYQQFDPKAIEALKAARNQVIPKPQSGRDPGAERLGVQAGPVRNKPPLAAAAVPTAGRISNGAGFAEEFIQKLASVEKEKTAIDEEMANVEKLWSGLVEKKKKLEDRRNELIKVKDKLQELDKEMNNVLKFQKI